MSTIHLVTNIKAPVEVCFDLSRSVELHILSTAHTKETAIDGKTSGLCDMGDTVTWRAKHFGFYQKLTVRITDFTYPVYFEDQMVAGAFRSFTHKHYFKVSNGNTSMEDSFEYYVPYGIIGKLFDKTVLYMHMKKLLVRRNNIIRQVAESGDWRRFLKDRHA